VLKRELARSAPLFSYRYHEGFGKVVCSRPPLASTRNQITELTTAPYPGFHNDELLPQAGIDPAAHRINVPPVATSVSSLQRKLERIGWFAKQAKWLAVIAYRGRGMRQR
jgi:hypothetical protein